MGLSINDTGPTPVNWEQGEDVIIAGSVPNKEAKPFIRVVPQPE